MPILPDMGTEFQSNTNSETPVCAKATSRARARTLIVATLGPSSLEPQTVAAMVAAGVGVFRINLSHGDRETHRRAIATAAATGVAVMIDLPGPKIRIRAATVALPLDLPEGARLNLAVDGAVLPADCPGLILSAGLDLSRARLGSNVLIDDGNVELVVTGYRDGVLETRTRADSVILDRKGVAFVDEVADFPPFVDEDRKALVELKGEPFDWVAASFVRSAECVVQLKNCLKALGRTAKVIAKIEDPAGVRNIDGILQAADGIMVARGDLGVCTPLAALPVLQKQLVALAIYHRKTVIVATQMLESMTQNRRPTRAEVTDVANAVLDGADAVMLSGETAVGRYPVETVATMSAIIRNAELAVRTGLRSLL